MIGRYDFKIIDYLATNYDKRNPYVTYEQKKTNNVNNRRYILHTYSVYTTNEVKISNR